MTSPVTKSDFRKVVRREQDLLTPRRVGTLSTAVQENILRMTEFAEARSVGCYLAMPMEVLTDRLIQACREEEKLVAVPAFSEEEKIYRMAVLETETGVVKRRWDIAEPREIRWTETVALDLMVVPGVAFDRQCNRVGHGGGFYDRMLSDTGKAGPLKVGAAFSFQLFDRVPVGPHDVPLDAVVTDQEVFRA